jgi:hypothetical protein
MKISNYSVDVELLFYLLFVLPCNPNIIIIRKNKMDHNGDTGKWDMAAGFTMNARPISEK